MAGVPNAKRARIELDRADADDGATRSSSMCDQAGISSEEGEHATEPARRRRVVVVAAPLSGATETEGASPRDAFEQPPAQADGALQPLLPTAEHTHDGERDASESNAVAPAGDSDDLVLDVTSLVDLHNAHRLMEFDWRRSRSASTVSWRDRCVMDRTFDVRALALSDSQRALWDAHPHCRQAFIHECHQVLERDARLSAADRLLTDASPSSPYRRREGQMKTVDHWGQRKLLISEIEFLTMHATQADVPVVVIYVGAAPGNHIQFLADELFPTVRFVLYDPRPFEIEASEMVSIQQERFTDEIARNLAPSCSDVRLLLISDVRSYEDVNGVAVVSMATQRETVAADMSVQRQWTEILRPAAAMLKFCLPYSAGHTEYLDGDLHLPVWTGPTSSETRLIVVPSQSGRFATRVFDHETYSNRMFHFNTVTRTSLFPHNVRGVGLDGCFDCASEVHILEQYLRSSCSDAYRRQLSRRELRADHNSSIATSADVPTDRLVARMSSEISRALSFTRTLALPSRR
ncbi:hypothetical protein CAOG_02492 [Capsaspora owczarzaki ATCC 30864]|uniref:Cap-specific mRNA (nucleoside-2'-O-)-methyltransferase n=1 Tax=Capsaspora owczarzaki (strain ATCC 30864) TaxID=595528 RepID=A0A0D2WMG3_CAPO3|nr:hypothetical protein CAOG_02492 [Capsaspora owczarzaki ATCC 30864]KJE91348.1 hypothetical protein CAOG_002492 [Capsaspora owczarzaki ATCC 30864]|eukprot:XP_004349242.1 hypothetical protein CAOG_02492 [Capsaspora owczarzaki ATCC 30864]